MSLKYEPAAGEMAAARRACVLSYTSSARARADLQLGGRRNGAGAAKVRSLLHLGGWLDAPPRGRGAQALNVNPAP